MSVLTHLQAPMWLGGALAAAAALFNLAIAAMNHFLPKKLSPEVQAAVDGARESIRVLERTVRMINDRFRDSQRHQDRVIREIQDLREEIRGYFGDT